MNPFTSLFLKTNNREASFNVIYAIRRNVENVTVNNRRGPLLNRVLNDKRPTIVDTRSRVAVIGILIQILVKVINKFSFL